MERFRQNDFCMASWSTIFKSEHWWDGTVCALLIHTVSVVIFQWLRAGGNIPGTVVQCPVKCVGETSARWPGFGHFWLTDPTAVQTPALISAGLYSQASPEVVERAVVPAQRVGKSTHNLEADSLVQQTHGWVPFLHFFIFSRPPTTPWISTNCYSTIVFCMSLYHLFFLGLSVWDVLLGWVRLLLLTLKK